METIKSLLKRIFPRLFKKDYIELTVCDFEADLEISMNDKYVIIGTTSKTGVLNEEDFLRHVIGDINGSRKFYRVNDKTSKLPLYINTDDIHKFYVRPKLIKKYTIKREL